MFRRGYNILFILLVLLNSCQTRYFNKYIIKSAANTVEVSENLNEIIISVPRDKFNNKNLKVYIIEDMIRCINDSLIGVVQIGGNTPPEQIESVHIQEKEIIEIKKNEILRIASNRCKNLREGYLKLFVGKEKNSKKIELYTTTMIMIKDGKLLLIR